MDSHCYHRIYFGTKSSEKPTQPFSLQGKYMTLSRDPETPIDHRALAGSGAYFAWQVSQGVRNPRRGEGRLRLPLSFPLVQSPPPLSSHIQGSCSKFQDWKDLLLHWLGPLKVAEAGELVVESPKSKHGVGTPDLVTACLQALLREDFRKGINAFLPQPQESKRKRSIPLYCRGMEHSVTFIYFST